MDTLRGIIEFFRDMWNHRQMKQWRTSTKAGLGGLAALLTTSALGERLHAIDDWDSLIVLIITWLITRLSGKKAMAEESPPPPMQD